MPTQADVERLTTANRDIRALVLAELGTLWAGLDTLNADGTRDALLEAVPLLVATYGEVAATVAADFYEELRDAARVAGRFTPLPVTSFDLEALAGRIRWSVGPLYSGSPDPAGALGRLELQVDEFTLQQGRETIAESVARDPAGPRWARVPMGDTCKFCITLASRGPVYRSAESAGRGRRFHGKCDCQATPIWPNDPLPEGYDPDALYEQYNAARKAAGTGRLKPVLAEMRARDGGN